MLNSSKASVFHGEGVWGGGCAFYPEIFFIFDVRMTCFDGFLALF